MIYKTEIKPFNDYWLSCDTSITYALLISICEKLKVYAYNNNYVYDFLSAPTPSQMPFYEIRLNQEFQSLLHELVDIVKNYRFDDYKKGIEIIKSHIKSGQLVQVGVDLYYWIESNMCFHNHHADHYTLVNGYDDEKNVFYVIDMDNQKYLEIEIPEEKLLVAMSYGNLAYNAMVFKPIQADSIYKYIFSPKELKKNAKKIIKSIHQFSGYNLWLYNKSDYKECFYRDMEIMYMAQIMCRMKANRFLFDFLIELNPDLEELKVIREECYSIEKGWVDVKEKVSKLFFKSDPVNQMIEANIRIHELLHYEENLWMHFIKTYKKIYIPDRIT